MAPAPGAGRPPLFARLISSSIRVSHQGVIWFVVIFTAYLISVVWAFPSTVHASDGIMASDHPVSGIQWYARGFNDLLVLKFEAPEGIHNVSRART